MANEISRDALIVYLYNLRALETAVHIDEQKKGKLESDCNLRLYQFERNYERAPAMPYAPSEWKPPKKEELPIGWALWWVFLSLFIPFLIIIPLIVEPILYIKITKDYHKILQ